MTNKTIADMERLADDYAARADALRSAAADMANALTTRSRGRLPATLRQAAHVDAERRNGGGLLRRRRRPRPGLSKRQKIAVVFGAMQAKPTTIQEIVVALQAAGHPIQNGNGISGPLNKWVASKFLHRRPDGRYTLTAKGDRRLADVAPSDQEG